MERQSWRTLNHIADYKIMKRVDCFYKNLKTTHSEFGEVFSMAERAGEMLTNRIMEMVEPIHEPLDSFALNQLEKLERSQLGLLLATIFCTLPLFGEQKVERTVQFIKALLTLMIVWPWSFFIYTWKSIIYYTLLAPLIVTFKIVHEIVENLQEKSSNPPTFDTFVKNLAQTIGLFFSSIQYSWELCSLSATLIKGTIWVMMESMPVIGWSHSSRDLWNLYYRTKKTLFHLVGITRELLMQIRHLLLMTTTFVGIFMVKRIKGLGLTLELMDRFLEICLMMVWQPPELELTERTKMEKGDKEREQDVTRIGTNENKEKPERRGKTRKEHLLEGSEELERDGKMQEEDPKIHITSEKLVPHINIIQESELHAIDEKDTQTVGGIES